MVEFFHRPAVIRTLTIVAMALVLLLLVAGVAEATHQRMNNGTGPVCPHCSSWNLICKLANVIDRCKTTKF